MRHLELTSPSHSWPNADRKTRVLLVAINVPGYYSLPVRILSLVVCQAADLSDRFDARFVEWEKSEDIARWTDAIAAWRPSIVGFSVNIWNRDACVNAATAVKRHLPKTAIVVGGQEVTGSVIDYLDEVEAFDYLIDGEAEISFGQFLRAWDSRQRCLVDPAPVSGLRYRDGGRVRFTGPAQVVSSLDEVPSAILAGLVPIHEKDRLGVLLEGARGCPFRCAFCFEGAKRHKVRIAPLERLSREAEYMATRGATSFHMMDPILCNGSPKRLRRVADLFTRLKAVNRRTEVSVEAYGDQITERIAECLGACSVIDIGLQTTNPPTVEAIHRRFSEEKFRRGMKLLRSTPATFNIYLISALPHETVGTYLRGIRFAMNEQPTRLFLNELCLLNGTELRRRADEFGYEWDRSPPYKVRASAWMSRREMSWTGALSKEVERRHNLCRRALLLDPPWVSKTRGTRGRRSICLDLGVPCRLQCPGCAAVQPEAASASDLDRAADADVEISIGYAEDAQRLTWLLGQCQLAGVARIKLVAPPSFFADRKRIDQLVSCDAWHFKTFLRASAQEAASVTELLSVLKHFADPFLSRSRAEIRPHVEVVVLPEGLPASRVRETIARVAQHHVSVVTLPEQERDTDGSWPEQMVSAFHEAAANGYWLKLPEALFRLAAGEVKGLDEIVGDLDELGMISHETGVLPCYRPSGRRESASPSTRRDALAGRSHGQ